MAGVTGRGIPDRDGRLAEAFGSTGFAAGAGTTGVAAAGSVGAVVAGAVGAGVTGAGADCNEGVAGAAGVTAGAAG